LISKQEAGHAGVLTLYVLYWHRGKRQCVIKKFRQRSRSEALVLI
jgi:hypothetical protein